MSFDYSLYIPLIGWFFLPTLITRGALYVYHSCIKNAPAKGSKQYTLNWKYCYTLVISVYLMYSLANVYLSLPTNFYSVLNVSSSPAPEGLKQSFRRLSLLHHPDRSDAGDENEFIRIRTAYEALSKRPLIYYTFGNTIEDCSNCKSLQDALHHALPSIAGYYIGTGIGLVLFSIIGGQSAIYLKAMCYVLLLISEVYLITHQTDIGILPVFEWIQVLRQMYVVAFIAMSQVLPLWMGGIQIGGLITRLRRLAELQVETIQDWRRNVVGTVHEKDELKKRVEEFLVHLRVQEQVERRSAA